jgi:hypothetical protein
MTPRCSASNRCKLDSQQRRIDKTLPDQPPATTLQQTLDDQFDRSLHDRRSSARPCDRHNRNTRHIRHRCAPAREVAREVARGGLSRHPASRSSLNSLQKHSLQFAQQA